YLLYNLNIEINNLRNIKNDQEEIIYDFKTGK
ncbi:MAG: hypothetical protein CI949_2999, partial [Halanaerobium sp.]